MRVDEFWQWLIEHKDYAQLYSSLVATGALIFSIISNYNSKRYAKKDKKISDARYEEQRKQYEEKLEEERNRREEDKFDKEEKLRLSEKPYLVFKKSKIVNDSSSAQMFLHLEFINKGRDTAYDIIPDMECNARKRDMTEFRVRRYKPIQDPVVMVGETFKVVFAYQKNEAVIFSLTYSIRYKDASERTYKQTFCIDIVDKLGNANITNYAQPELCD